MENNFVDNFNTLHIIQKAVSLGFEFHDIQEIQDIRFSAEEYLKKNKNHIKNILLNVVQGNIVLKSIFFAQYWKQPVQRYENNDYKKVVNGFIETSLLEKDYLLLKPVSEISDEDAIHLIKLKFKYDKGNIDEIESIHVTKHIPKKGYCVSLEAIISHKKWNDFVVRLYIGDEKIYSYYNDYLRSKGYAVPFMEYSVEDLISFGWVRLI